MLLCVSACNNGDIIDNEQSTPAPTRTLKLNAAMPGEATKSSGATTRLSLTETDEGTISVKWKEGDKINLCFVSGDGTVVRTVSNVPITNILDNGKKAIFEINIPKDITGTFNLYGVYGASFSSVNSREVYIPNLNTMNGTELIDIENKSVMRFALENLTEESIPKVFFSHLGTILGVIIDNMTWNNLTVNNFGLSSFSKGYNWIMNYSNLDIVSNSYINTAKTGELRFYHSGNTVTIDAGGSHKFYRWFMLGDTIGTGNSATQFEFMTYMGTRNFTIPISTIKLEPGKFYRLRMDWNGTILTHNRSFVADIDGNSYKTVNIGTQKWMAENLKVTKYNDGTVIPNVIFSFDWKELTTGALCNYEPPIAEEYGKLYNWHAVKTGKLCPTGWHVPNDSEWNTIQNHLITKGYNYDVTTTDNKIAKAMATASGWDSSTTTGAVGNNDYSGKKNASGFSALPAGFRHSTGGSYSKGVGAYWWTSTEASTTLAKSRAIESYSYSLYSRNELKTSGFSIRCVRD